MNSPFPYENYAENELFFGREEELHQISKITESSNNIQLHSKRRMGKSSLIRKFLSIDKNAIAIYVDIFDITSPKDFAKLILNAIAKAQKGDLTTIIKNLPKLFKRIQFNVGVDSTTGEFNFLPKVKDAEFEELIDEIFEALFTLSKEKKVFLAIDEFQQIALFKEKKIDALLRKYIQMNKNISYIFLGSKRHVLFELFQYKSPLYEMATQIELLCIKNEDYYKYITGHLDISSELIEYIIDISACETKLIQHICHIIYRDYKLITIEKEHINIVLQEVLLSKNGSYSSLFDSLTINKKKAFKILSKYNDNFFKKEILDTYEITRQSLTSSFNQLFKDKIIDKSDNKWFIPNRALELWGKKLNI